MMLVFFYVVIESVARELFSHTCHHVHTGTKACHLPFISNHLEASLTDPRLGNCVFEQTWSGCLGRPKYNVGFRMNAPVADHVAVVAGFALAG